MTQSLTNQPINPSFYGEAQLSRLLQDLTNVKLLVVGDVMLDRYIFGEVDRISPEAPIPILRVERTMEQAGGAGNVARNLATLGCTAHLVGLVGDDKAASVLQQCLETLPLSHDGSWYQPKSISAGDPQDTLKTSGRLIPHLWPQAGYPTIEKTRFIANRQQLLRSDQEKYFSLSEDELDQLLQKILAIIDKESIKMVALSDYGKGTLPEAFLTKLLPMLRQRKIKTIIDPKGHDYRRYHGVDYITPNRQELKLASGMICDDDESIEAASRFLLGLTDAKAIIATRSEQGMSLIERDKPMQTIKARARAVYDVAGAGDTVVAAFAAALSLGRPLAEAAFFANLAAGVVVAKPGTAQAFPSEILKAEREGVLREQGKKIFNRQQAQQICEEWRDKGETISFTNGCFDLLHPGHISLLQQASEKVDRLVVAINSDDSVRRLKGPTRPVQSEENRATVLAALGMVDMVVVFDEDTPLALIKELRPHVLVKGADYTVAQVVGADDIKSWGGEVRIADLLAGHSTTNTIKKLHQ